MRFTLAFLFFLSFTSYATTMEGVYCEGKLYTADYLSLEKEKPFYPQFSSDEFHPVNQRFQYGLLMNALIQKFAPELTPSYNSHLSAFLGAGDNIAWQRSEQGFPSKTVSGETYNIPARCHDEKGNIEVLTLIVRSKQGDLIALEYDPKLIKELHKDGLQLSYLLMGTYFRSLIQNQKALAAVNWFFHAETSIRSNPVQARDFLINAGILKPRSDFDYCNLGHPLQQALMEKLKLPCEEQTRDDILAIKSLTIKAEQPEPGYSILKSDFRDLSNLEHLSLSNFGENIGRLSHQNYQSLINLKTFKLSQSYLDYMPQEMMYGLKNLVELNLSGNDLYDFKAGTFQQMIIPLSSAPETVSIDLSNNPSLAKTNQYGFIAPGAFRGAAAVTHLNLSRMQLKGLKSEVFDDFKRLRVLNISKNYFKRLKGMLNSPGLSSVTHLDMSGMGIKRLSSSDFSKLKSLEVLKFSNTKLRAFPMFLTEIKTLKELTFCSNFIPKEKMFILKKNIESTHPHLKIEVCQ